MAQADRTFDAWVRSVRYAGAGVRATYLRPRCFFVARSGVLTLAFSGFPNGLLRIKRRLAKARADLPEEYPGSLWPKVTLAALTDGRTLTPAEIKSLRRITREMDAAWIDPKSKYLIEQLEIVELFDRAVERVGRLARVPLADPPERADLAPEHAEAVSRVLDQWRESAPGYEAEVARPGYREPHYRSRHHEFSLIVRPGVGGEGLDAFREAVDHALPEAYVWFSTNSRHVTLRTLGGPK